MLKKHFDKTSYIKPGTANKPKASTYGAQAEQLAQHWLQKQGLSFVTKNYRCRRGEIDLIMLEDATLIFVEVRYRKHGQYGDGAESVDYRKQQKLVYSAEHYIQNKLSSQRKLAHVENFRFDVVAATNSTACKGASNGASTTAPFEFTWIKSAFTAD